MRKLALAAAFAAVLASPFAVSTAQAQTAAPAAAPTPDYTLTGNMALVNDYRFRGISQTLNGPAIQGGIDFTHNPTGIYLGNWDSNVSGVTYPIGNGAEMDFYGGWRHSWGDFGLDVGALYYYYNKSYLPGTGNTSSSPNNLEGYISVSWKWLSFKYSYAFTNYFGMNSVIGANTASKACWSAGTGGAAAPGCTTTLGANGNSNGSQYYEANASYEIVPKWTLSGHVGHVNVRHYGALNYTDYKVGIAYAFDSGWSLGAAVVGTDANKQWYSGERVKNGTNEAKDLGTVTGVVTLSKTF